MSFAADPRVRELCGRGPVTPDHVIRTKQRPLVLAAGADAGTIAAELTNYRERYVSYFSAQQAARGVTRVMLDPDPRVVLMPGLGDRGWGSTRARRRSRRTCTSTRSR